MPTPSLLIVPARFKTGRLYSQIPVPVAPSTSSVGDFTVTRNTAARRFGPDGLIASVASGIPRLDYYTSGGVTGCPALLVEPAATNGILNSADTTTSWLCYSGFTSGYIDVIGVSGNNLTVDIPSNIGTFGVLRRLNNSVALASGSTYTISFLIKKTGTHTIGAYYAAITGGAAGDLAAGFDVSGSFSSGQIYAGYTAATNRIRRVERFGTDVFRCSETFTMSASGTLTTFHFAPVAGVTSSSNSASGTTMGFAAPQIELGSFPTSFIPTTTGQGSRSADVISVSGAVSGAIGQTEGTIYFEYYHNTATNAGFRNAFNLEGNVANYFNGINFATSNNGNDLQVAVQVSGSSVVSGGVFSTSVSEGWHKVAFGYNTAATGTVFYFDGNLIATRTLTSIPAMSRIALMARANPFSGFDLDRQFNNRIRAAALYTTRLTNAELATLTTP